MLDYLTSLYLQVSTASKENPVLAGVVSLWGLSVFTYVARNIPAAIGRFLYKQLTTNFTVSNAGNDINQRRYNKVVSFILERKGLSFSRSLRLRTSASWSWNDDVDRTSAKYELQPGYDLHFFIWKKRLFWYHRSQIESSSTSMQKEVLTIYTLGRSHESFYQLYEEAFPVPDGREIDIYRYQLNDGWTQKAKVTKRPIETVIIADGLKEMLMQNMRTFMDSKEWYQSRGISWKEAYVLHGPTGTGKTSIIKALASHFNLNIYEIDLSTMSNASLSAALSSLPPMSVCLMEDFDSVSAVKKRKKIEVGNVVRHEKVNGECVTKPVEEENDVGALFDLEMLTLSGILNSIDGIGSLHGCMIFMTTNCIDSIDMAMLRKGRADYVYYVGWLGDKEIKEYISIVFPDAAIDTSHVFKQMPGCDVYAAFKENRNDVDKFVQALLLREEVPC